MATRKASSEPGAPHCDRCLSTDSRRVRVVAIGETAQTARAPARYRMGALDELQVSAGAASVMRPPTLLFA
jgi:hypothetical protein